MRKSQLAVGVIAVALLGGGCGVDKDAASSKPDEAVPTTAAAIPAAGELPVGDDNVTLDPANFTTNIDNPYWPMSPGSKWVFRESGGEGEQRVEITVTNEIKRVAGIDTRVIHDVVTEDGEIIEDTWDWFAQDKAGNVWYFGEETKEFENGAVSSTKGSWEAGVNGAQAGVVMPRDLKVGLQYRQEYLKGEAEDAADILSVSETVEVPFGRYTGVLKTFDHTPLDATALEHKFYAKGVGPVLVTPIGNGGREELIEFTRGS